MALTVKHTKTNNIPAWTQAELNAQIALGNYPVGTLLADITLSTDWNTDHALAGVASFGQGGTGSNTAPGAVTNLITNLMFQSLGASSPSQVWMPAYTGDFGTSFYYTLDDQVNYYQQIFTEGPFGATDNAITRFDGTSGKVLQNSTVLISDAGIISGAKNIDPAIVVSALATGGAGTSASPWTGWETPLQTALTAGARKVVFYPGYYNHSVSINLGYRGVTVSGYGAYLKATSAMTTQLAFETTALGNTGMIFGAECMGLELNGNSLAQYGLGIRHCHASKFADILIYGCTAAGLRSRWAVLDRFERIRISNVDRPTEPMPATGFLFDDDLAAVGFASQTTAGTVQDCVAEGCSGDGFVYASASSMVQLAGSSEANGGRSVWIKSTSGAISLRGVDIEVNTGEMLIEGNGNIVEGAYQEGNITITGNNNKIASLANINVLTNSGIDTQVIQMYPVTSNGTAPVPHEGLAAAPGDYFSVGVTGGDPVLLLNTGNTYHIGSVAQGFGTAELRVTPGTGAFVVGNVKANAFTVSATFATGDIFAANSSGVLTRIADVATGNALISGGVGVAPLYGKIGLTTHVSGTLPVANGGTGAVSYTAGQILTGNGTSAIASSSALTFASNLFTVNTGASTTNTALFTNAGITNAQVLTAEFTGGNVGAPGDAFAVVRIASNSTIRDPLSISVSGVQKFGVSGSGKVSINNAAYSVSLNVLSQFAGDGFAVDSTGTNSPQFSLQQATVRKGYFALANAGGDWSSTTVAGDVIFGNYTTGTGAKTMIFSNQDTGPFRWEVSNNGSSAVTRMTLSALGLLTLSSDSGPVSGFSEGQIKILGATNSNKRLLIGVDTTSSVMASYIQSVEVAGSTRPLNLQPQGGAVAVGVLPPSFAAAVFTVAAPSDYTNPLTWANVSIASSNTSKFVGSGYDVALGGGNGAAFFQGFYAGSTANIPIYLAPLDGDVFIGKDGAAQKLVVNGIAGVGVASPTAILHLKAGTATANTAPLQFNTGTNETTARGGLMEYNNRHYVTNSSLIRTPLGGTTFDHFVDAGNTTTSETDLYTDTLLANTFAVNGDKVEGNYGGIFVSSATATRQIKVKFAGTTILDTGALSISASASWSVYVLLQRVSSTVVRYTVGLQTSGASLALYNATGELTGLTLSGTNILKITGQAAGVGAATNDIVAKLGYVEFKPSV